MDARIIQLLGKIRDRVNDVNICRDEWFNFAESAYNDHEALLSIEAIDKYLNEIETIVRETEAQ